MMGLPHAGRWRSPARSRPLSRGLLILVVVEGWLLALSRLAPAMTGGGWPALEGLWLVLALCLAGPGLRRWLAWPAACALGLATLLALLDDLSRLSLGRAFNPLLDASLVGPAYHLMVDNVGKFLAPLLLCAAGAAILALTWGGAHLLGRLPTATSRPRRGALVALLVLSLPVAASGHAATPLMTLVMRHWQQGVETRQAWAAFRQQLADGHARPAAALPGLAGRDVSLAFIESYGVSALFDPRYAPVIAPRLAAMQRRFDAAGLHVATSRLTSPVQGGQSWLAHGTVISGLWLTSQRHYDLLLTRDSPTLIDDFRLTGHRSVAIMPAITAPWPAGRRLGYDIRLAARDIPYRGPALNWVTMPDQYTWRFFADYRRSQSRPLFTELAMISSHAPWTPILPLLDDWDDLQEGRRFDRWATAGPAPEVLWQDAGDVRRHYIRAIDYALAAMAGFAERYLGEHQLLIVLGDHQPAPLITGDKASRDVPIHVISRDAALIARFEAAGFRPGLWPSDAPASRRQDALRGLLHRLFGARSRQGIAVSSDKGLSK